MERTFKIWFEEGALVPTAHLISSVRSVTKSIKAITEGIDAHELLIKMSEGEMDGEEKSLVQEMLTLTEESARMRDGVKRLSTLFDTLIEEWRGFCCAMAT